MVRTSRPVIAFMGFVMFSVSAIGSTGGYIYNFDPSPTWSFQYDDIIRAGATGYGEVGPPLVNEPREFYLVSFVRNDEELIVDIDTNEFEVPFGEYDYALTLASVIAEPPNISYTMHAELYWRADGAGPGWTTLLDSASDVTYTD